MLERFEYFEGQPLPPINPGEVIRETPNFQVVTDYKPGFEGQQIGERFFIEPLTSKGGEMLLQAAIAHNIFNFNVRPHPFNPPGHEYTIPCLRADYVSTNIPVLLQGEVQIPQPGEDTIPSPDRMEKCIAQMPELSSARYSFEDDIEPAISNPQTRHLRLMQATHLDAIPQRILSSADENRYYKVRKGWWFVVVERLAEGIRSGEFADASTNIILQQFLYEYSGNRFFNNSNRLTTAADIVRVNKIINLVWQTYGNK